MRAKKKLIISMLVVSFVLLSIIATVAIAFALTQQTIKTTLNIGYTVEDIDGTASATFTIGGVTENLTAMKGTQVIGDKLVFKAGDTEDAGNLMFPEDALALSAQNDNVVIQYTYSNTGSKHYIASMDFAANIEADNMKVEYSIDGTTYSEDRYAVVVPANTSNKSYWIKISIADKAKSASFTGDFNWLLSGCDPQSKEYLSLASLTFQGSDGAYSTSISEAGDFVGAITFPSEVNGDKVTTINPSTLSDADKAKVTSVYIPDSVTNLDFVPVVGGTFENFINLETVTFEQNETAGANSQNNEGLKVIGDNAFAGCASLEEFTIPDTVTTIGNEGFAVTEIESIVIPDSVITVGGLVFSACKSLTNIVLGTGVNQIDEWVFMDCTNLKNITTHTLNANVVTAIKNLANANGEMNLTIDTVTFIPESAFADCKSLTSLTIGESVLEIETLAFDGCKGLTNLIIGNGVLTIGFQTFAYCTSLTNVTLGSSLDFIDMHGFYNCTSLTSIVIPASVTCLNGDVFAGCTKLTSVTFENKTGWVFVTGESITEEQLRDPANAAILLKGDYAGPWERS